MIFSEVVFIIIFYALIWELAGKSYRYKVFYLVKVKWKDVPKIFTYKLVTKPGKRLYLVFSVCKHLLMKTHVSKIILYLIKDEILMMKLSEFF